LFTHLRTSAGKYGIRKLGHMLLFMPPSHPPFEGLLALLLLLLLLLPALLALLPSVRLLPLQLLPMPLTPLLLPLCFIFTAAFTA
jgi:hypothetical protein